MSDGIKGLESVQSKLSQLAKNIGAESAQGLYLSGLQVEENAKRSITEGGKTGRVYRKGKNGTILHRASAPGEAPASDTGRLVNSIRTDVTKGGDAVQISAGSGIVDYARHLEFGTNKMAARPFFQPALKKALPEIEKIMKRAVKTAISTATKK